MREPISATELMKLNEEGKTVTQIAQYFGCSKANISKRLKKLRPPELPPALTSLTKKEQQFVLSRSEGKTLTQSALESFECGSMDSAKNVGSQLAKRNDIQTAISTIMEQEGIGRRHRIRALKRHINNRRDAQASLKGIDISNKMEGIYTEEKITINVDYGGLCKELTEVQETRRALMKELGITSEDQAIDAEFDEVSGTNEDG